MPETTCQYAPVDTPDAYHRRWVSAILHIGALIVFLLLVAPLRVSAQTEPPDMPTYETWLREAFAAAQRGDRLGLQEIAPQLTETTSVRGPDQTTIPVDNTWLAEALNEESPDLPQIAQRLGALLDSLSNPGTPPPDDAQQRLDNILKRPPFIQPEPVVREPNLLERFLEWFFRQLDRLFGHPDAPGAGPARAFVWLLVMLSVVLLVGVVLYLIINMRRSLTSDAYITSEDDADTKISATAAFQQASALARDGDYRTAMRYLYLSALLWLDERSLLRYDRALTNREYLERLNNNPDLRAHLTPIVDTFDRVWYGYDVLNAEDFARYQRQVEDLRKRF